MFELGARSAAGSDFAASKETQVLIWPADEAFAWEFEGGNKVFGERPRRFK